MDKTQLVQTILTYLVPLISVALSYLFGHMQATKTNKTSAKREQHDNFYLQYTSKIYAGMMWKMKYSDMPLESKSVYFDLIMENIHYLDKNIVELVPDFYEAFVFALDNDDIDTKKSLDNDFNYITMKILFRTSKLSKELKLPDFARFALERYYELPQR